MSVPSSPTLRRQQQGRPTPAALSLEISHATNADIDTPPATADDPTAGVTGLSTPTRHNSIRSSALSASKQLSSGRDEMTSAADPTLIANTSSEITSTRSSPLIHSKAGSQPAINPAVAVANSTIASSSTPLQRRTSQPNRTLSINRRGSTASRHARQTHSVSTDMGRFLVTVVPPEHLPHDPPHPKSNPNCTGYGPPAHFR